MERAIELAKKGTGFTNPNPLVGAVIVKDGKIIGEGYHEIYGSLHAERNALKNCTQDPAGADIYVTLEPCCHYGKQPPCTDAIIKSGIKHIYMGSYDPNPLVAGKSIKILKDNGIEVTENVMRAECDSLNDIFFHYITTGTPYVIMKMAVSIDGRIASHNGDSKWITNEASRAYTHQTRKRCASILVGINTVLNDDPMLTCRCDNPSDPVRIVCDSNLRIPMDSAIMKTAGEIPTIIATVSDNSEKIKKIENCGAKVISTTGKRVNMTELMNELGKLKIDSILVEGGASIHASMLKAGIVNKLQLFIAPKIIGGDGRAAVDSIGIDYVKDAVIFSNPTVRQFGDDIMIEYDMKKRS